jgi:hypothetical protein
MEQKLKCHSREKYFGGEEKWIVGVGGNGMTVGGLTRFSEPRLGGSGRRTQHTHGPIDGICHALAGAVGDLDTLGGKAANLITIISLCNGYVNLVGTHRVTPM